MTERERALLFRQQAASRRAWEAARLLALAGDPMAAAVVHAGWEPLRKQASDNFDPEPLPIEDTTRPAWLSRVPGDIELPEHLKRSR